MGRFPYMGIEKASPTSAVNWGRNLSSAGKEKNVASWIQIGLERLEQLKLQGRVLKGELVYLELLKQLLRIVNQGKTLIFPVVHLCLMCMAASCHPTGCEGNWLLSCQQKLLTLCIHTISWQIGEGSTAETSKLEFRCLLIFTHEECYPEF